MMSALVLVLCVASLALASRLGGQAPATRMVTVDGRPMRVHVEGLDGRAPGAPIVAYDRSGLGQSAWDEQTPTRATR